MSINLKTPNRYATWIRTQGSSKCVGPVHRALSSQITSLPRTKTNPGATWEQMALIRNSHAYRQKYICIRYQRKLHKNTLNRKAFIANRGWDLLQPQHIALSTPLVTTWMQCSHRKACKQKIGPWVFCDSLVVVQCSLQQA